MSVEIVYVAAQLYGKYHFKGLQKVNDREASRGRKINLYDITFFMTMTFFICPRYCMRNKLQWLWMTVIGVGTYVLGAARACM